MASHRHVVAASSVQVIGNAVKRQARWCRIGRDEGEPDLNPAFLQPLVGWVLDQGRNGKLLAGARVFSDQNFQTGLGIVLGYAIAGLLGVLFIRESKLPLHHPFSAEIIPGLHENSTSGEQHV